MFFSENTQLEAFISFGKYQQALEVLNSIEKKKSLSVNEKLIRKYIQSFIYLDKGEFNKGKAIAEEMIEESKLKNIPLREIDGVIAKIENCICLTLFDECFELIKEWESLLSNLKDVSEEEYKYREAYFFYLKGRTFQDTHIVHEGLVSLERCYQIRKEINDKFGILWVIINTGHLETSIGNFQASEDKLNEGLIIAEELDVSIGITWILIILGWIKYHTRELNAAMKYANRCLPICIKNNFSYALTICYDLFGHCDLLQGKLDEALTYFEKSLNIRVSMGHKGLITQSYYSIGNVFSRKGELKKSLEYYEKGLNIPVVEDRAMLRPAYLSVIGKIYGELGDFYIAKKYLLEALDLLNKRKIFIYHFQNFSVSIAKTYHYLIVLSLTNNDLDKIDDYIKQLYELSNKYKDTKQIKQIYELDEAIILKSKERLREKMKAGIIFKKISEEETSDHEISIEAMTHLCEILIYELELSGDISILEEIEELSDKLLNIAKSQYLYDLLAETYFLKAQISKLNLDIKNSRIFLNKAQDIANKHNLKLLANKISNEHDSLLTNLDNWENNNEQNKPIKERINQSKYEFLFSKMIRVKIEKFPKQTEKPVFLVILSIIDGHCLYNKSFEGYNLKNGDLIAGFISAINMFGKETFAPSGSIDRIKHGEFLIIFQVKENFLFGYVFIGHSYSASTKFNDFILKLYKEEYIIKELKMSANSYTEISNKTALIIDQLSNNIFIE